MTPDELPADMEAAVARLERAVKDAVLDLARANLARANLARADELPADMEGLAANLLADLGVLAATAREVPFDVWDRFANNVQQAAALLKAYQEQRRALERLANKDNEFGSEVQTIAQAALNQKGDER